ncbi:uncharacterized protein KGF55_003479 [Candida pseudojiufengensis]|uniref:uncharacterized protein n=1 Tax=Candida pseudojiufengensis TaxID=497109 RepID=UPI002223F583|nr:uncharacterized protein KGF55_003479 [Candida pseudojiufengensis]KAI5962403.1 hypothetical protein KGF55_003479 [Candida pseudojiufengensis]
MPPAPPNIPGYYFDTTRGRYFKVTNGAIPTNESTTNPTSDLSKYHNNSIQAEKRTQEFEEEEAKLLKAENDRKRIHSSEIYKDPKIKNPIKKNFEFNDVNQKFKFDSLSLLNLKTGKINYLNSYWNRDVLNRIKFIGVKEIDRDDHYALPRGHIIGYDNDDFVIVKIRPNEYFCDHGDDINCSYCWKASPEIFNCKEEKLYKENQPWFFNGDFEVEAMKNLYDFKMTFEGEEIDSRESGYISDFNPKAIQILSVLKSGSNDMINVLRFCLFNREKKKFTDLTFQLVKFLKNNLDKLNKRGFGVKSALGLGNVELIDIEYKNIKEINEILKEEDIYSNRRRSELNKFLSYYDGLRPNFVYGYTEDNFEPSDLLFLDGKIINNKFFLLFSGGEVLIFDFNPNTKKFSNFKFLTTSLKLPDYGTKLEVIGTKLYITTRSQVVILDYSSSEIKLFKNLHNRRIFILSHNKWLLVRDKDIVMYFPNCNIFKRIIVYNHGNAVYQQFEIINDKKRNKKYLIFNMISKAKENGVDFKLVDLNTDDDVDDARNERDYESIEFKIEFQFLKFGYLKQYALIQIVDLGEQDGKLHIGFLHENCKSRNTIFESFLF